MCDTWSGRHQPDDPGVGILRTSVLGSTKHMDSLSCCQDRRCNAFEEYSIAEQEKADCNDKRAPNHVHLSITASTQQLTSRHIRTGISMIF